MISELEAYYVSKEEPVRSTLLALRSYIINYNTEMTETWTHKMPMFRYKGKLFCYLWTDKKTKEPYLLMVEGKLLNHPDLEEGKRARMKIFRVNPNEDLPIEKINLLLNDALDLYRNGIIKLK